MEKREIIDNHYFVTNNSWEFQIKGTKSKKFGIYIEILDMYEATGEEEYKNAPYTVFFDIMAAKPHKSFHENGSSNELLDLIYDCHSYMGGIPIDHVLSLNINDGLESIKKEFTINEAITVKNKMEFGTYAAQNGKGSEIEYLMFKTEKAAQKYVDLLLKRANVLGLMIGFILDRPINMAGDSGWSVIKKQVKGCK